MRFASTVAPQDLSRDALVANAPRVHLDGAPAPVPALDGIPLVARLGQGAMGAVYYGIHPGLNIEVAVKVLPFHLAEQNPEVIQRFYREAQAGAKVRSPHLVEVRDVREQAGVFFLVMEFVAGKTAGAHLREQIQAGASGLPEGIALDICIAAGAGLAAAHAHGIIHRDVKPDNILVPYARREAGGPPAGPEESGQVRKLALHPNSPAAAPAENHSDRALDFAAAKLADLGLARSEEITASLTGSAQCLGTPGYMSPEQASDAKTAQKPADVFSLGATLYALLAGRAPFTGSALLKVLNATANEPHVPIRQLRPDVSEGMAALLDRCLAKDPAQRFADAAALLAALRDCRATLGLALTVRPPRSRRDSEQPPRATAAPPVAQAAVPPPVPAAPVAIAMSNVFPVARGDAPAPIQMSNAGLDAGRSAPAPTPKPDVARVPRETAPARPAAARQRRWGWLLAAGVLLAAPVVGYQAWRAWSDSTPVARNSDNGGGRCTNDIPVTPVQEPPPVKKIESDPGPSKVTSQAQPKAAARPAAFDEAIAAGDISQAASILGKAERAYQLAKDEKPGDAAAVEGLRWVEQGAHDLRYAAAMAAGNQALKDHDWTQATFRFGEALLERPDDRAAQEGVRQMTEGAAEEQYQAGVKEGERLLQQQPPDLSGAETAFRKALALWGNNKEAAQGLDKVRVARQEAEYLAAMAAAQQLLAGEAADVEYGFPDLTEAKRGDVAAALDRALQAKPGDGPATALKKRLFAPPAKELTLDLGGGVRLELVPIRSGKFMMGSPPNEEGRSDDETLHEVTLTKPFYLGKYEVTQEQYEQIVGANPSKFKGAKNPVEQLSREDAQEFCTKASQKTGQTVRLPTEAEWEYACRAGTTTRFCSGDADGDLDGVAWYTGTNGHTSTGNWNTTTHPVGQKSPNAWGLYDMHGNLWEWCQDWYANKYEARAVADPHGPANGNARVLRGGSVLFDHRYCRSASRSKLDPADRGGGDGFRVAVTPKAP